MRIALCVLWLSMLSTLGWAEIAPPANYDPLDDAKACQAAGGATNLTPAGKYNGCTFHIPSANEVVEIPQNCTKSVDGDGVTNLECDCSACHHATDELPNLVGRPDDWPAREVPVHYQDDPNRQKI